MTDTDTYVSRHSVFEPEVQQRAEPAVVQPSVAQPSVEPVAGLPLAGPTLEAPPSRPAGSRRRLIGLIAVAAVLLAGWAITVGVNASAAAPVISAAAPAIADAEGACRTAFRTAYEQADQAVKERYAREEPDFFFRTSMDDVNVWTSIPNGTSVEVTGDVEWTLTTGVLGSQAQTNRYSCTATVRNNTIATSVH